MSLEKTPEEKELDKERFLAKQERITDEVKRLNRIFTKIDKKAKSAVKSLIENAAFMAVTLADLQDDINRTGAVSEYQNGENQWGTKKSPEVEIYNTMVKNHASIIKQLTDLLPKPPPGGNDIDDGFDAFLAKK